MKTLYKSFSSPQLLVIGDIMLDKTLSGITKRISPEAPVQVLKVNKKFSTLGGAGNVAANISSLRANVFLVGVAGEDQTSNEIIKLLKLQKIKFSIKKHKAVKTIEKVRVVSQNQQLIRLDFEDDKLMSPIKLDGRLKKNIDDAKLIIFSDYGKGGLDNITHLIKYANSKNKIVIVDPKGNDFSKYAGADYITPNMEEFTNIVGKCETDEIIEKKGKLLAKKYNFKKIILTRSEKGISLIGKNEKIKNFPAVVKEVFDVTGAGDTVIATIATFLSKGQKIEDCLILANEAAGIVVKKAGSAKVSLAELYTKKISSFKNILTVKDEEKIFYDYIENLKFNDKKIVMTNGCFDLLHVGHIKYLEEAKALGDFLIVAINDDQSTKNIKGTDRPINMLEFRKSMLSALNCVDWVVTFSENTPIKLIKKIKPDILVKGGDYTESEIVGYDFVKKYGGRVKKLSFVRGFSSTKMIKKIRGQK